MVRARRRDAPERFRREFQELVRSLVATVWSGSRVSGLLLEAMWAYVVAVGRRRITDLLRVLGRENEDWSRMYRLWSRRRWRGREVFRWLRQKVLESIGGTGDLSVVLDSTRAYRSGTKIVGVRLAPGRGTKVFARGLQEAQRIVIASILTPVERGYSRAIPVAMVPAFGELKKGEEEKVRGERSWYCSEWRAGLRALEEITRETNRRLLVLCDGSYNTVGFWKGLPESCVAMVRGAKNQKLYRLPEPRAGRGRRRCYGEEAPKPQEWLREREGWLSVLIEVRGRLVELHYRVEGPFVRKRVPDRPLYLIVVRSYRGRGPKKARKPAYYLVTAVRNERGEWVLPLRAEQLLAAYWQRWEQEVVHRGLKSEFGLGQQQCWSEAGSVETLRWTVWLFGLMVLCAYRAWGVLGGPRATGRWCRRQARWTHSRMLATGREVFLRVVEFRAGCRWFTSNVTKKEGPLERLQRLVGAR